MLVRSSAICDEFECYGYRRVELKLRHQGVVVNHTEAFSQRLMRRRTTCGPSDERCYGRSRPIVTMADR